VFTFPFLSRQTIQPLSELNDVHFSISLKTNHTINIRV